ncbi:MAG: hypothetical protein A2V90_02770 [Gammaproteobacteria bacterium RBG_16_57_12]|nr:MAG: hypothetical protein A2V90_02770 [Gammaproteobacteria bacterium RBG_16_57_12]
MLSVIAITLYLACTVLLLYRLVNRDSNNPAPFYAGKPFILTLGLIAVALHTLTLTHTLYTPNGLNLSITSVMSLTTWLITALLLLVAVTTPVEMLGIIILPSTALALGIDSYFPSGPMILNQIDRGLETHILISIIAYSVLSIAAIQAILLAIQDHHLRHKQPGGFIRSLPPLQTMETLLFRAITLGFILDSIALLTGALFLEDIFAQHLVHKTVLSIVAWLVFATLLWGRHFHGWRGQTAIRWTLSGFVLLFLAYFGSKFVLEVLIQKQ